MRWEDGVSLIEVLVAVTLIGLALIPLMQLYPPALDADREAETGMRLGTVAARKMEDLIQQLRFDITSVVSGSESCAGNLPTCWLEWTVASEASSATMGVGVLIAVNVIACLDGSADLSCGAGEQQARNDAKVTSRP
ncbi:MAG TPA: prepilin-type N-terminal cleavage/methylation domain-containing protein [bacterium]|jgi:prepilin-type N-terminal cleavage/methylation domain-containing protein|nr:prepilin-type N-terminal cleavage/methylation domain-containing protein [bacterium]